jgi:hypothetical protein
MLYVTILTVVMLGVVAPVFGLFFRVTNVFELLDVMEVLVTSQA